MTEDEGKPRRKRARLACTACNARRVKCNVTESRPCHNCIAGNVLCETVPSRRGKHPRRPKGQDTSDPPQRRLSKADPTANPPSQGSRHHDELAASHVLASLSTNAPLFRVEPSSVLQQITPQATLPDVNRPPSQDDGLSPMNEGSEEEEEDGAVFLGESNSLRYLTDDRDPKVPSPPSAGFRHSIPSAVKANGITQWESERRREKIKALQLDGTFSFPLAKIRQELLESYFRWFHPQFAVVDEPEVWKLHSQGTLSPLLLQAMLFIGAIHCDDETILALGWGSRHRVRYIFYNRAKDIYDADCEVKKLTVIQSLFLISFWRAAALREKDARHWLGAAISLAQSKALHRSGGSHEPHILKLRRRLWWAIYIRERQCAAALGLPTQIRDEDCDVESLSPDDFRTAFDPSTSASTVEAHTAFGLGMTELAKILGNVMHYGYLPNRPMTGEVRTQLRDELLQWMHSLPRVMHLSSDAGGPPSLQAGMLHLKYNNLLILLHRSRFIGSEEGSGEVDGNIALQAASRNSRIVEDMLSDGKMGHCQIHAITALFNSLCIHVTHLRRAKGINSTIAEHRAKVCLLGLQELQQTWEFTNWILQLFFQYLDRTTVSRLEMEAGGGKLVSRGTTKAKTTMPPPSSTNADPAASEPTLGNLAAEAARSNGDEFSLGQSPWSWTTDEANQYLFTQIENDFAFGEGGLLPWSPDELLGSMMPDVGYGGFETM
ncbi:cutinase transcription factor 1 alpha [Lophiotrema nucula]|uniref:Cutinase transcription factor 1 alpha n=1 Tax=Lophiotrema nucula TaxID=690887 RepID=A0A6A5Z619_9PLEO|nr:cutinase transcription factor 1 alpha [Lophiotrema nucula]